MTNEPASDLAVRVLFAGACQGQFFKLCKKIEKVNTKNGPFDALFCIGQFFSSNLEEESEFMSFITSQQRMPIATYVLGAYGHGSAAAKQRLEEVDCNIQLLGKRGILSMQNGLKVAYLEGMYDPDHFDPTLSSKMEEDGSENQYYTNEDVEFLRNLCHSTTGDIDFFLSCEWPAKIMSQMPLHSIEGIGPYPEGSQHISSLLTVIRPRYHFTSEPPMFFSRLPYKNPDLGAGSHVTRFTSLCPFESGKKNNLFALYLTPSQYTDHEKLLEIPHDATEFPFTAEVRKRELEIKVNNDVEVVGDSSCTSPGLTSPPMMNPLTTVNSPCVQFPQGHLFPTPQRSSPYFGSQIQSPVVDFANQASIETLMQSLGRSNAMSGLFQNDGNERVESMRQTSFGQFQGQIPIHTSLNLASVMFPNISQPTQSTAFVQQQVGGLQNILLAVAQNPVLFNTAVSMGLLPQNLFNPGLSTIQNTPGQDSFSQQRMNLSPEQTSFGQFVHPHTDLIRPPDMPMYNVQTVDSMNFVQEGQTLHQQQTKRHRKTGQESNRRTVKDRRKTCYVGQLPSGVSREDITDFFSQAGEVATVVKRLDDNKQETNWAFVQFTDKATRDHAIKTLHHSMFAGKRITVKPANEESKYDPNEPVNDCWFCLGSPSSDKNLIVSIANGCYVAVDKGPITDDHVLVIPTSHYPSTLRVNDNCYHEIELYLNGLKAMFESEGKMLIAFERYLQLQRVQGNHTHLSVISIDPIDVESIKQVILQKDVRQSAEWNHLPPENCGKEKVRDMVGDEEYFLVILPDGSKLVRPIFKTSRLPVSFGRDVLAQLVDEPERADWKICVSSQEDEKLRVEKFKSRFQNYDFPNKS